MPDAYANKPSEFGGAVNKLGIQPPPHIPTASEQLSLMYRTGDVDGSKPEDGGLAFSGLIPADQLLEIRTAEGVDFTKGGVWDAMKEEAEQILSELAEEIPDIG